MAYPIQCPWDLDAADAALRAAAADIITSMVSADAHAEALQKVATGGAVPSSIRVFDWQPASTDTVVKAYRSLARQFLNAVERAIAERGLRVQLDTDQILNVAKAKYIPAQWDTIDARCTQIRRLMARASLRDVWQRIQAYYTPVRLRQVALMQCLMSLRQSLNLRAGSPMEMRGGAVVITISQCGYECERGEIPSHTRSQVYRGLGAIVDALKIMRQPTIAQRVEASINRATSTFGALRHGARYVSREKVTIDPGITLVWFKSKVELLLAPEITDSLQGLLSFTPSLERLRRAA